MNYNQIKSSLSDYKPYILGADKKPISSVLLPLVEVDGEIHIIFETRSSKLRTQPLDVSFPGGRIDKEDASPMSAAVRETCEELGLTPDQIDVITELDLFMVPYGVIIHNFVGKINDISKININEDEVDSIFTVPLSFFMENDPIKYDSEIIAVREDPFPFHLIPFGRDYPFKNGNYEILFWHYNGKTIWGFTAAIVKNFVEQITKK